MHRRYGRQSNQRSEKTLERESLASDDHEGRRDQERRPLSPPHATAFAIAREPIPQCILPEVEVFLGDVPITKYETTGDQKFADTVLRMYISATS